MKIMDAAGTKLINVLLDKYERSRSFTGNNKVNQYFTVRIADIFPKYDDEAEYDYYLKVQAALEELESSGFVRLLRIRNGRISSCTLMTDRLADIYNAVGRVSKRSDYDWIAAKLNEMTKAYSSDTVLASFVETQKEHMQNGGSVEYYNNDRQTFEDIMTAVVSIPLNDSEIYIRDFSVKLFHDSKRLEKLKNSVQGLLYKYGDFEERDHVFEECGIVDTPTYVSMKGAGKLIFADQVIDLVRLNGDIALSTETLKGLEKVEVCGDRVITIENMTSFHDCDEAHALVIYLGGFHNHIKREFLKKVYRDNQDKSYLHFGDIDAGGFYIYEHLCRKTGIPFAMMNMGIEMLEAHKQEWNKLTVHDAKRLEDLKRILDAKDKAGIRFYDYRDTINFMINNKCKIEQEQLQELYDL